VKLPDGLHKRLPWILGGAIFLVTWLIFWPTLGHQFVNWDDDKYVVENPHVIAGLGWESLWWALTTGHASNWHPLTWVSHMVDCQLWGLNPLGHHAGNVVIHSLNVVLLFCVLRSLTRATWRSALVTALFAWHPLHVESVAWISERKDLLCTFWAILAVWAYVTFTRKKTGPARALTYSMSLVFFAAGLLSKPMVVTLPFILMLLDYWPLRRIKVGDEARGILSKFGEKIPFLILSVASSTITYFVQQRGGAVASLEVIPLGTRFSNAIFSYVAYIEKAFWPHKLCAFYPYAFEFDPWQVAAAFAFLAAVTVAAVHLREQFPYFLVGWFWFIGTLIPVIGLIQVGEQAMADRYTYIPIVGLFVVTSWFAAQLVAAFSRTRIAVVASSILVLLACAVVTQKQLRYWENGVQLFTRAIAVTKKNATAHHNLGLALTASDPKAAVRHFETALQINPNFGLAHNNLGAALIQLGRNEEAITHYQMALQTNPKDAEAHFNLANALNPGFRSETAKFSERRFSSEDIARSETHYLAALRFAPDYVNAYINLGNLKAAQADYEAACVRYRQALEVSRFSAKARLNLANALIRLGRPAEAIAELEELHEFQPQDLDVQLRLANLSASQGQFERAIIWYRNVIRLDSSRVHAYNDLGSALAHASRFDEAAAAYAQAIRLKPDYGEAYCNLGSTYLHMGKLEAAIVEFSAALKINPKDARAHHQLALIYVRLNDFGRALTSFSEASRLNPARAEIRFDLALAFTKFGAALSAIEQYQKALALDPDLVPALNNLAWLLATWPEQRVRNADEAVKLAKRACELTQYQDPLILGTLDAAYGEAGDFTKAVDTAMRAYQLAEQAGRVEIAEAVLDRLTLYWENKAWHQPSPTNQFDLPSLSQ
jgi:protein O-mannosyl-transferase